MTMGLALAILALGTLGQSVMGFGGGLIAIPLLSLLLGVKDAVTLGLVMQVLVGTLALRARHEIEWRALAPLLLALLATTLVGTYFLGAVNESALRISLAVFIFLFLLKSTLWSTIKLVPSKHPIWGIIAGSVGGAVQGMLGTGGPPLVIYFNETMDNKDKIRNALLLVLMISNLVRITVAIPTGLFRPGLLQTVWLSIPCILVVMVIGQRLHAVISEVWYRRGILVLLSGSCVSLLLKAF